MKRILLTTCLAGLTILPTSLQAQTPPLRKVTPGIDCRASCAYTKQMVEGQPIDTRPTQLPGDHTIVPGQTRAPYHKTVDVNVTTLASDLDRPFAVALLPDGKFLVTEKAGRIRILNKDGSSYDSITDLPPLLYRGQVGLLDIVLDPHYASNHRIFFMFNEKRDADNCSIAIASATLNEVKATLSNTKVIWHTAPYPNATAINAGGRIAFSPKDGTIFAIIGDRSNSSATPWMMAQQLDNDLGKLIHITVDGKPAPGNPKLGGLPEIYTYGHRSEQGLAFAPDGRLWETENGPRGGDKLNLIQAGKNYGWPLYDHGINYSGDVINQGEVQAPDTVQPVYYWDPAIAPAGMVFYRGNVPQWKNSVFLGALAGTSLIRLELSKDDKVVNEEPFLTDINQRIRDVREGKDGALYVLTDGVNAKLLKLTPK
jgi:glucose/arabinose dehydrogenase